MIRIILIIIMYVGPLQTTDIWKLIAMICMSLTSMAVSISNFKLFIQVAIYAWNRNLMRTAKIMVGNKGPFTINRLNEFFEGQQQELQSDPQINVDV